MIRRVALLLVSAVFLLSAVGCTKKGSTRVETDFAEPSTDITDSTGQFGNSARKGEGDIYVKLAVAYMREGRLDVALQKARTAIEVESGNADTHNIIALIYDQLAEYGLAERHFLNSLKLTPQNSYVLNAYGSFLCTQKRYDEADLQFKAALLNPLYKTPEVALTNAGICVKRKFGDLLLAEQYFRQALAKNKTFSIALLQMALLSYDNGEYLSSRAYLQRFLAVAKPTAGSLLVGIQNEKKLGDQDAVASYTLLLKNNFPDSQETQRLRELEKQ